MKNCLECGNKHYRSKFCSRSCSARHREKTYLKDIYKNIQDMYNNGKTFTEISSLLNISISCICKYAKKIGIKTKPQYVDYTGKDYTYSKVIRCLYNGPKSGQHTRWLIRCNCGKEFESSSQPLSVLTKYSCLSCMRKRNRQQIRLTNSIWKQVLYGAKARNINVEVDKDYAYGLFLKQNKKCALTGINIDFAETSKEHLHGKTSASLDRIDSTKGYVKGNLQWLHKDVNKMKWNLDEEYFISLCTKIANINKKKRTKKR